MISPQRLGPGRLVVNAEDDVGRQLSATHTAAEPISSAPLLCGHVWLDL